MVSTHGAFSEANASERYRIIDRVGSGGLGVVYRVEDRTSGDIVAMKVMPRTTGVGNLRSEFLALARLHHENIVSVFDYGLTESGHDYFTMELIDGPPLLEAIPTIPSAAFYQLLGGMLRGLAFVHAQGIVHADIKPSNILVSTVELANDPLRAAKLVDFGLSMGADAESGASARGTFPYAAPEVYAGRLDARSDLYSVGVVLYELTTGVQPYTGRRVTDVLAAQRRGPPRDPRELRPELPEALAELIMALLDPEPGARPQTIDELVSRVNEIGGTEFAIEGAPPLLDMSGSFVGRERDLAALTTMWDDAGQARGSVALVCGEAGIGKTRLLAELKLSIQLMGGRVLCADATSTGDTPYGGITQLLRGLIAGLGDRADDLPEEWSSTIAPLLGDGTADDRSAHLLRYALAEAVTGVMLTLASEDPALIIVDNADQADQATVELLCYLARSVADSRVMFVIAARSANFAADDTGSYLARLGRAVANAQDGQRFDLPPLDRHNVFRLAEQAFGHDIAKTLGDDLYRAAGGNSAFATGALNELVRSGAIARERGQWIIKQAPLSIPTPAGAIDSARARLAQLSADAKRAVDVAAVLGETFDGSTLTAVYHHLTDGESDVGEAIAELISTRLISADAASGMFQFPSTEIATTLYDDLHDKFRRKVHTEAASHLESRDRAGVVAGRLARHYLAIDDYTRGVSRGIEAAVERSARLDHYGALAWYERIREHVTEPSTALAVDEQLGRLQTVVGDIDAACAAYRRGIDACEHDPEQHIELALKLGELQRRLGDGNGALETLMNALNIAREKRLSQLEGKCHLRIGWVLMYRAEYKAATEHAVAGELHARRQGDSPTVAELGRLHAAVDIYQGDPKSAMRHLEDALEAAEATGEHPLISGILHAVGRAAIHSADYNRAIDALERAIEVSERGNDVEQVMKSLNNLGAACYFQGEWLRARTTWERFRRLCERLDEQSELVNALNNLGSLYRELGQFAQAISALDRAARLAKQTGHTHMQLMILGNRGEVLFRQGDLAGAREMYSEALKEFTRIGAQEDVIETRRRMCELDIANGKLTDAVDRVIDTARAAKDAGARLEEGILHRVAATALRLQGDTEGAEWFIKQSREILVELGAGYELAKADLEAAELAAAQNRLDQAGAGLNAAINGFVSLGARWDLTRARARKRLLPAKSFRPDRGAVQLGIDALLEITQAVGQLDLERLLGVALDKILEISHFERGFILLLDADGRPSERMRRLREGAKGFERDEAEFSGTIVRKVAASGVAVAVNDIANEDELREQESVVALGLRQIMCAPMHARGRTIGIVYIDSRRLAFEEQGIDLTVLEALAAQVSMAIENSRLLGEEERKGELMAVLAHEIRNPLSGILGYSDTGASGEDWGLDPKELFSRIHRDAERLRRLVDNIMELVRSEEGNMEWSMVPFDMNKVVEDIVESYAPACETRGIKLEFNPGQLKSGALGSPDRIMQVLSNLLTNALKFTPKGGTVTITTRYENVPMSDPEAPPLPASQIAAWTPLDPADDLSHHYIRVDVKDTGPGMPQELTERLFQKFSQGRRGRRSSGVGLGLYISREIIGRHGGTIFVKSKEGEGSTFSFRLRLA